MYYVQPEARSDDSDSVRTAVIEVATSREGEGGVGASLKQETEPPPIQHHCQPHTLEKSVHDNVGQNICMHVQYLGGQDMID